MTNPVQDQYESYPYPGRNPAEEATRLVTGSPSRVLEIDHYLFGGKRDWSKPFRVLVAGGGTGDATVMLAQQLHDKDVKAEITYLDLSTASRRIAEQRIKVRGLTNVSFLSGSLLDLAAMGLGGFDYIDCCGVLHHLPDPDAGLASLAGALAPGGGIGIMVYGEYGRAGLYPLQAALRQLAGDLPLKEQVALAKKLLPALPVTNGFRNNRFLGDHRRGDAELVDLLLHRQDRAYTVPQLAGLVAGAGLRIASFIEPLRYDPSLYLTDPVLAKRAASLPAPDQAALAERLAGNMKLHIAYLSRESGTVAQPAPEAIPLFIEWEAGTVAKAVQQQGGIKGAFDGLPVTLPLPRQAPAILRLIDGTRRMDAIRQEAGYADWDSFMAVFRPVWRALNGINRLVLRH
ncbi:class I SAM-dependent methyltransferase [Oceanibaculum sp.]|uniref:class I SAM-dependent methyltransferase n=1 Tax=Oceanibaculum sp. TaxID=1903597 RepID=UPI002584ACBE|nr:class I SAM-dependent methyltransferase [Oceanibaculum sp.]MCH2394439.1 class I SAM-dependent methyltransferase [Oceanibaculum sp.]